MSTAMQPVAKLGAFALSREAIKISPG